MVQELVDRNLIRAEDAAKHPEANKILRALGIAKDVAVDLRPEPLAFVAGDVLVLCSDGLSDLVEPAEILQIAGSHPPAQSVGQLVDLANARGGHDNITALVVRMKTSAKYRDAPTLLKTVPLAALPPTEPGAGPTGTIVSAPMGGGPPPSGRTEPPPAMMAPIGPAAIPPHPDSQRVSLDGGSQRSPMLAIGIVLAVLAVAIVAAVVITSSSRSKHRTVMPVFDPPRPIATAEPADDGGAEPAQPVVPAPTLGDPSSKWKPKDGGAPDPCGALRRAQERDASAAVIKKLDERCRAVDTSP
jgi:protein phosphatase